MPDIFDYQNYREYLRDYYEEKKASDSTFSYQNFSRKAGFASKSFIFNVINGRKNLSRTSVVKICESLKLSKSRAAYFENLVYFNQASNFTERNFYFGKLNAVVPAANRGNVVRKLRMDQYEFYSKWYHTVIRSLIDLFPEVKDHSQFAGMVYPAITGKQVLKSVELLVRLGLVEKKDGTYKVNDRILSTGREVESLAVTSFHLECMELAAKALKEVPADRRNVSGLTLGISAKAYDRICEIIHSCQKEILDIAERDTGSDRVYQLNFHLFPVSGMPEGRVK